MDSSPQSSVVGVSPSLQWLATANINVDGYVSQREYPVPTQTAEVLQSLRELVVAEWPGANEFQVTKVTAVLRGQKTVTIPLSVLPTLVIPVTL